MPSSTVYPTATEYREALFNTHQCFRDPVLQGGTPVMDVQGMPKPISGAFATVFTVTGVDHRKWAVKCFTRNIADQQVRYERISASLASVTSSWRVPFDYVPRGILCSGQWYPILKMEWIEASGLMPFIQEHLWQSAALARLAKEFAALMQELSQRGIAHGDLQHGNLLVTSIGSLKLIDYDGMYVPGLEDLGASELGHRNYQSPARTSSNWGPELDRFSAWFIYCSLVALTIEPALWGYLHRDGEEALIFSKADFVAPDQSVALRSLLKSPDQRLLALGRTLSPLGALPLDSVPLFDPAVVPAPSEQLLAPMAPPSSQSTQSPENATKTISEWLSSLDTSGASSTIPNDPSWVLDHLPPLEPVEFRSVSSTWLRGVAAADVLALALLVGFIASGNLAAPLFVIGVALIVLFTAICTLGLFVRTPEWKEKHAVQASFRQLKSDAGRARKEVGRAHSDRQGVDRGERDALDKISKLAVKASESEQSDLSKIGQDLTKRLSSIEKSLQSLAQAEDKERAATLRNLQAVHVANFLASATIARANLPGIGRALEGTLRAYGISSAADFTGISRVGSQVFINRRSGGSVHPTGIGDKKAGTLEAWRRAVLARAQATAPATVPDHHVQAIKLKYTEQRMALERSTSAAKTDSATQEHLARQKWATRHTEITDLAEQARNDFARQRADADVALIGSQRTLNAAAWQEALGRHQLAAHSGVTYLCYCARGLRG